MSDYTIEWTELGGEYSVTAPTKEEALELYDELNGSKVSTQPVDWNIPPSGGLGFPHKNYDAPGSSDSADFTLSWREGCEIEVDK